MNSTAPSQEFFGLAVVALLLGVKHGLDADHLAAIDGLTRSNAQSRPRLARIAGLLFSLGHGAVVLTVALAVALFSATWKVPAWLGPFGAWVSIAVLTALTAVNIVGVWTTPADRMSVLVGWRAGLFSRWLATGSVPMVIGIGALFALSFDSLTHATLFAMSSTHHGGGKAAAALAILFVTGMLLADGANGWWISRLIRRSDQAARIASRVMGLTVAGVGLLTAGLGVAVQTNEAAAQWAEGKALWFGLAVLAIVLISFWAAMRLAGAARLPPPGAGAEAARQAESPACSAAEP